MPSPGQCNGQAIAYPLGGTSPYSYLWSAQALSQTTQTAFNLCAGSYNVQITDAHDCQVVHSAKVDTVPPDPLAITPIGADDYVKVYPNPTTGLLMTEIELSETKDLSIEVFDVYGRLVENHFENNFNSGTITLDLADLSNGLYIVSVNTADSKYQTKIQVVH